ncbi:hypothetical protein V6N13_034360 [Hibiscus sabdariffa]
MNGNRRSYRRKKRSPSKSDTKLDHQSDVAIILGVIDVDKLAILESCTVGFCNNAQSIRELAISFRDASCSDFNVMRISGSMVLLMFESAEIRTKILNEKSLNPWLDNVMVWHPSLQIMTRRIWLSIRGISIHAWSEATFRNIATRWRILVDIDQDSLAPSSFETCRIQIETDWNSYIDEKFNLVVDSVLFMIQVMAIEEATGPKCECCCAIDVASEGNLSYSSKALEGELDTICKMGKINDTVVADSIDTLEGFVAEKLTQDRPKFNLDRMWLENRKDDTRILDLSVSTIPNKEGQDNRMEIVGIQNDIMYAEGHDNQFEIADIHNDILNVKGQDNRMEIADISNDILYAEGQDNQFDILNDENQSNSLGVFATQSDACELISRTGLRFKVPRNGDEAEIVNDIAGMLEGQDRPL